MRVAQLALPVLISSPWQVNPRADIVIDATDPLPAIGQFASVIEFIYRAVRHRCSLLAATTRDIEFNGGAHGNFRPSGIRGHGQVVCTRSG